MSESERSHRLALWLSTDINRRAVNRLLLSSQPVTPLFEHKKLLPAAQKALFPTASKPRLPWDRIDACLNWAEKPQNHLLFYDAPQYPLLLKHIASPPPILLVQGELQSLSNIQLAMVGSRNPSAEGRQNARHFSQALSQCGFTITSGLAMGIDTESHHGALSAQGKTIAVLGSGIDIIYPRKNKALAEKLCEQGALVSEFPLGSPPQAQHFPRRNRIITGLALGVLVVEAALKSGSLISAQRALEQNRDVFALPSSIHNPLARGCHQLLRDGAKLVETIQDILDELPLFTPPPNLKSHKNPLLTLAKDHQLLVKCMNYSVTTPDTLVERSGLSPQRVAKIVTELEIQGIISAVPGGYIKGEC